MLQGKLMDKHSTKFFFFIAFLLVSVGFIAAQMTDVGSAWNDDFKVSDYLALLIAVVTFGFSYLGIKHNRDQRILSVMPHIEKTSVGDSVACKCGLYIKNYGLAPVIKIKLTMYINGQLDTGEEYEKEHRKYFKGDKDIVTFLSAIIALILVLV